MGRAGRTPAPGRMGRPGTAVLPDGCIGTGRCRGGGRAPGGPVRWAFMASGNQVGGPTRRCDTFSRDCAAVAARRRGPRGFFAIMPKAKGKGGKNRRRGRNDDEAKRELVFKDESQEYAQVVRMLGNGRLEALCFDGEKRLAHIRGKMRKKVWINNGDIILLSLREFEDGKADVIQKYTPDEARSLKQHGELPEATKISEDQFGEEGDEIEFQEASDDDAEEGEAEDDDEDLDDL